MKNNVSEEFKECFEKNKDNFSREMLESWNFECLKYAFKETESVSDNFKDIIEVGEAKLLDEIEDKYFPEKVMRSASYSMFMRSEGKYEYLNQIYNFGIEDCKKILEVAEKEEYWLPHVKPYLLALQGIVYSNMPSAQEVAKLSIETEHNLENLMAIDKLFPDLEMDIMSKIKTQYKTMGEKSLFDFVVRDKRFLKYLFYYSEDNSKALAACNLLLKGKEYADIVSLKMIIFISSGILKVGERLSTPSMANLVHIFKKNISKLNKVPEELVVFQKDPSGLCRDLKTPFLEFLKGLENRCASGGGSMEC